MFSAQEIQKDVQDAINLGHINIPDGHTKALVVHADTDTKAVTVAYVEKLGDSWELMGYGKSSLTDKNLSAGFNLEWSK